ncbi:hypothetical protein [Kaistella sp.]|uniref:hypothetical protein n=1 Tax=Kaistella sp. TaxID=2782235 RepID=UPI003C64F4DF
MKKLISIIFCIVCIHFGIAQEISLNNINSSNVLDYYKQTENLQQQGQAGSVNITTQIGNDNNIEVIDRKLKYLEIIQRGDYNTTYFTNPNNYPTNAEIKINGSRNYIDITGSNSISNGMKMNINANDMTMFMRNY